ncbi:hypothetical protein [Glutamicibacter arilaitensis]|uniref:hypothetical protein n=1 Tax=Glutamicibacter arilaitensis TaxID=256701 RepID=UPI003FD23D4E
MMIRMGVRCPGCEQPVAVRMATDSTIGTRFYFPCPNCRLPIRGSAVGHDISDYKVSFEAERLLDHDISSAPQVVTVNPYVPNDFSADTNDAVGGFSMMTLDGLTGKRVLDFMEERDTALGTIRHLWPQVRRLYEYYLDEHWDAFESTLAREFSEWGFPTGRTTHDRASAAHSAMLAVTVHVVPPSAATASFLRSYMAKHMTASADGTYSSMLKTESTITKIKTLQRALFDILDHFLLKHEMWLMGGIRRYLSAKGSANLERMTLARDEFGETRDLYQQGFEVLSKVLKYPIAARNTIEHGDPENFGDEHPADVPTKDRVDSLAKFSKLSNAYKLRYFQLDPEWDDFGNTMNSKTRNLIGHGVVRHNLRTGRIVTPVDANGINYLIFLGNLHDLFDSLSISLQVLRALRITSSTDWPERGKDKS